MGTLETFLILLALNLFFFVVMYHFLIYNLDSKLFISHEGEAKLNIHHSSASTK